jgi:hypothetical protein
VRALVQSRLRSRFRLVTLDDTSFAPLGPRWTSILLSLTPAAALLLSMALWVPEFLALAEREVRGEGTFGGQAWLAYRLIVKVVLTGAALLLLLSMAPLVAHFARRRRADDSRGVARVVRQLKRLRSWWRAPAILAPSATVVTVADACWQQAVVDIARISSVVLIDISEPSPNICWELRALQRERVLLLARRDSMDAWWGVPVPDAWAAAAAEIRELAEGLPLIVYDEPEQVDQRAIVRWLLQQQPDRG